MLGLVAFAAGLVLAGMFFVLAVATANSCGMFSDGCETYGEPAPGFEVFAFGVVVACGVSVVGLIAAVGSMVRRRRP